MRETDLVEVFDAERPRLVRVAAHILGGTADAEDVVQTGWIKADRARQDDPALEIANLPGWLTVVTARTALDLLRARGRRDEMPFQAEREPAAADAADEEALRADEVGRALTVVVDRLGPAERVAFVLHDLFAVPFDDVGEVLGRSAAAAKQLASRARHKVGPDPTTAPPSAEHLAVVRSFLSASRNGDLATLLRVLAPDVVRTVDPVLVPAGTTLEMRGAEVVAEETRSFTARAEAGVVLLLDGHPVVVIAAGGRASAVLRIEFDAHERISEVRIDPARPNEEFRLPD